MGYSYCRFDCGIPDCEMGSIDLYDGVWVWPQGLVHYVEFHSVCLPYEFIQTMRSHSWRVPANLKLPLPDGQPPLRKVGYWRSEYEPHLPDPRDFAQPGCYGTELPRVLDYLKAGGNYTCDLLLPPLEARLAAKQRSWPQRLMAKLRKT